MFAKSRDLFRFETGKGRAIILSFPQNRVPAQTRLRRFQDEELKDEAVVMDRHAPFSIVVPDVIILREIDPRTTIDLFRSSYGHISADLLENRWKASILAKPVVPSLSRDHRERKLFIDSLLISMVHFKGSIPDQSPLTNPAQNHVTTHRRPNMLQSMAADNVSDRIDLLIQKLVQFGSRIPPYGDIEILCPRVCCRTKPEKNGYGYDGIKLAQ